MKTVCTMESKQVEHSAATHCYAAGPWMSAKESDPPANKFVLVWHRVRKLPIIAKLSGRFWVASGTNVKKADVEYWAEFHLPDGTSSPRRPFAITEGDVAAIDDQA